MLTSQFIRVPLSILSIKELSPKCKLLLGFLISYSISKGYAYGTNSYYAKNLGCSERNISECIKRLKELDLIRITSPKTAYRRIYINSGNNLLCDKNISSNYKEESF